MDLAEETRKRAVILRGAFDDACLDLIPSLRALRFVWMSAWVASRWFDPVFHEAFPDFGTDAYWKTQLGYLQPVETKSAS